MVRFYLDEVSPPKRNRQRPYPKNRDINPEAYDDAKQWQTEIQNVKQQNKERNRVYAEEKAKRNDEAAAELNRRKDVVMSALSDIANSTPFTGTEIKEAADAQRQEKLDKWHQAKNVIDATAVVAEGAAAGYGVLRGLAHGRRMLAKRAFDRAGINATAEQTQNLLKWNDLVSKVDKPQIFMNTAGGLADAYQWFNADNKFDEYENKIETGMNAAGVIGGTNWFKNLPYLRRIGGDKIDAVLDGMGYSAAVWDIIKNIPPLSYQLDKAKENVNK
jgi:hypothetical protein